MTGDMLNEDEDRTDILLHLVREACAIAPVYFSLGNHEVGYEKTYGEGDLTEQLEAAGAVVLEKEYVDTKIAGQEVRIGELRIFTAGRLERWIRATISGSVCADRSAEDFAESCTRRLTVVEEHGILGCRSSLQRTCAWWSGKSSVCRRTV